MNTPEHTHPPHAPDPLAVVLAKLDPAPHGFEWNALMFAAGRESKARALTFWRAAAGACAVAAGGFALAYFARPNAPTPAERIVYVDRVVPGAPAPVKAAPTTPAPLRLPEVKPEPPSTAEPSTGWGFDPPPEQGAAARWLTLRNEVLTAGLGVLPDAGPKASGPRTEK